MKKDSKKTAKTPAGSEPETRPPALGFGGILGVALVAGALFNIPAILKVPRTGADWLYLVIVLAMAFVGIILIIGRPKD